MNTFSDMIMRTHIGSNPKYMHQIWDDPETTDFFAKFVDIHVQLKELKQSLMIENQETGVPPLRSLLLEYEDDEIANNIID